MIAFDLREFVVTMEITRFGRVDTDSMRVDAINHADAIKQARKVISDAGWSRYDGSIKYRAQLASRHKEG